MAPFARRYSFFDGDKPAAVAAAMARASIYRFIPSNVAFIDNSSDFASKTTFDAASTKCVVHVDPAGRNRVDSHLHFSIVYRV